MYSATQKQAVDWPGFAARAAAAVGWQGGSQITRRSAVTARAPKPASYDEAPTRPVEVPASHIETIVSAMDYLSPARARILGRLLTATQPGLCGGNKVLQPLWANEMMDRAYQMVRLTRLLDRRLPRDDDDPMDDSLEWRIASNLTETLRALHIRKDDEKLPCSDLLRDTVRDMAELFGEAVGITGISTCIDRLDLPAFKRRALVLMASHLVVDILLHAAREHRSPQLLVTLDRPRCDIARLSVGYDDRAVPFGPLDGTYGVIDDLASLLETDIIYRADRLGRFVTGMEFPLR